MSSLSTPDIASQTSPKERTAHIKASKAIGFQPRGPVEAGIIKIIDASPPDPDAVLRGITEFSGEASGVGQRVSLITDLSDASRVRIQELRDPVRVGKEAYGNGLVNEQHRGKNTVAEHEEAQSQAYAGLEQKIESGLVDPTAIFSEIVIKLKVAPDLERVPNTYEGIVGSVEGQLRQFLEQGNLNQQEFESILAEITEFTELYAKAYGKEDLEKAYELISDNAAKLTYQNAVDKDVFSGSDHGTRHILDGNTRFAKQMIGSLRENGVNISAKDEVAIHQVMIDHDLGYTTGAAQAPAGWEASKDHPLVSAKFIEVNKDYYVDKFGENGFSAIHNSVLNHSYPKLEYQSDSAESIHPGLVRGITSTVDSLGVTVETKTPEFFWNKDAMRSLLKIRLAMETMGGKVPADLMAKYKEELQTVASKEPNADRAAGYSNAVENFFNEFTADNTLGHYAGAVRNVTVEQADVDHDDTEVEGASADRGHESHKSLRVVVEMVPSEVLATLGNMFGNKLANQSFMKAMKDLGLDVSRLDEFGRELTRKRNGKTDQTTSPFATQNKHARVIVGGTFVEDMSDQDQAAILGANKVREIAGVFKEAEVLSIRTEINGLLEEFKDGGVTLPVIYAKFLEGVTDKTSAQEIRTLSEMLLTLSDNSPSGQKDMMGQDITVSQKTQNALRGFLTQREREFLGV